MTICVDYRDGNPEFHRNASFKASVNKEYGPCITVMGEYPITYDISMESLQMISFLNDEGILGALRVLVIHMDTGNVEVWQ